uniref:Uncharacterized protein n=1 Tax=Hippocampus comes TaxID=109280 RepID=A0A3Q2XP77_HIPCM
MTSCLLLLLQAKQTSGGPAVRAVLTRHSGPLVCVMSARTKRRSHCEEAVIAPGTPAYENWLSPGGAVYRQFWFFNVQNAREVVEEGAAPVVAEKGPYTYL